jgi:hypothetical protein
MHTVAADKEFALGYWDVFQNLIYQLSHEDDLLVSRTGWLLASQFVLLVGYVSVDPKSLPSNPPVNWHRLICVVGLLSTVCIFSSILAAVKVYVELRSALQVLTVQHADLPMRDLPRVGIGPGLLCPILLALVVMYVWALLTSFSRTVANLVTASGICFGVYAVALGDHIRPDPTVAFMMWPSLIGALVFLVAALSIGARSIKGSTAS